MGSWKRDHQAPSGLGGLGEGGETGASPASADQLVGALTGDGKAVPEGPPAHADKAATAMVSAASGQWAGR
jgi:hypothetical protein